MVRRRQEAARAHRRAEVPDSQCIRAVRRARDLIDRDFAQPLDLRRLADEAGYSKFHFARAFAAVYCDASARGPPLKMT